MGNFKDFLKGLPSTTFSHCKRNASGVASTQVSIPNCVLEGLKAHPGIVACTGMSAKQAWENWVVAITGYKADPKRSITSQVSSVLDFWFVKDQDEWSKSPITRQCEGKNPVRYFYQEVEDALTGIRCAPRPTGRGESKEVNALTSKIEVINSLDLPEELKTQLVAPVKEQLEAAQTKSSKAGALEAKIAAQDQKISELMTQMAALLAAQQSTVKPV